VRQPGIYIHIPFCERKCTYCNFNTTDFNDRLAATYTAAVAKEVATYGRTLTESANGVRPSIDTIYFGGGTPSMVEPGHLARLLNACHAAFDVAPQSEVTIEINPATLAAEKVRQWIDSGVNRASVGVQSFIDHELASLSRTHTADEARQTIESLREAGFDNISIDLIAGLPEQTLKDWEFNLTEALKLGPEHLSLYLLEVKEGTQLFAQLKRGARPVPDEDVAAEMYTLICEMTGESGYEQYEISNFARIDTDPEAKATTQRVSRLRSKHNMKYWTGAPFYGMGCGAHSYDIRSRWFNLMKTETYIDSINLSGQAVAHRTELTGADRAAEALFMGLRLREGIDVGEFGSEYSVDVVEEYRDELNRIEEAGLIQLTGGRLMLTDKGRLLSNEVFVAFV
jgi:putative oxygen-independent coproporphyrinogen III oxidase